MEVRFAGHRDSLWFSVVCTRHCPYHRGPEFAGIHSLCPSSSATQNCLDTGLFRGRRIGWRGRISSRNPCSARRYFSWQLHRCGLERHHFDRLDSRSEWLRTRSPDRFSNWSSCWSNRFYYDRDLVCTKILEYFLTRIIRCSRPASPPWPSHRCRRGWRRRSGRTTSRQRQGSPLSPDCRS